MTKSQEMAQICKDGVRNELSVAVNIKITKGKGLMEFGYVQNKESVYWLGKMARSDSSQGEG